MCRAATAFGRAAESALAYLSRLNGRYCGRIAASSRISRLIIDEYMSLSVYISCIRLNAHVVIVHQRVRQLGNFQFNHRIIALQHRNMLVRRHPTPRFRVGAGQLASKPASSGKGGSDGTADQAQRACCHRILRLPDRRRLRHVLSLDAARCRSREAGIGRATSHSKAQGRGKQIPAPLSCRRPAAERRAILSPDMIADQRADQRIGLLRQVAHASAWRPARTSAAT